MAWVFDRLKRLERQNALLEAKLRKAKLKRKLEAEKTKLLKQIRDVEEEEIEGEGE